MRHLLAFIVCIFFLVSCNEQEVGTPFRKGQEVTLSAGIANQRPQMLPRMQRISGKDTDPTQQSNDGIIQLTWDKGSSEA